MQHGQEEWIHLEAEIKTHLEAHSEASHCFSRIYSHVSVHRNAAIVVKQEATRTQTAHSSLKCT